MVTSRESIGDIFLKERMKEKEVMQNLAEEMHDFVKEMSDNLKIISYELRLIRKQLERGKR